MKSVFLLLLALLLKVPLSGPSVVRVTFSPLTKAAYLAAKKTAIQTKPEITFALKKARGRIVISTAKGQKIFKDVRVPGDEMSDVTYLYKGYCAKLQQHLLQIEYYESSEWVIVETNGTINKVWSLPSYSPNLSWVLASSGSIEYEMMPNGLQLFRSGASGLKKVLETAPKNWAPEEVFWASDNTVFLKQKRYPGLDISKKYYFTYAKLTITP